MTDPLTDQDYDDLGASFKLEGPHPNSPMFYCGDIAETVQAIVRRHRADATDAELARVLGVLQDIPEDVNIATVARVFLNARARSAGATEAADL